MGQATANERARAEAGPLAAKRMETHVVERAKLPYVIIAGVAIPIILAIIYGFWAWGQRRLQAKVEHPAAAESTVISAAPPPDTTTSTIQQRPPTPLPHTAARRPRAALAVPHQAASGSEEKAIVLRRARWPG
jgi:hypothetical protein